MQIKDVPFHHGRYDHQLYLAMQSMVADFPEEDLNPRSIRVRTVPLAPH